MRLTRCLDHWTGYYEMVDAAEGWGRLKIHTCFFVNVECFNQDCHWFHPFPQVNYQQTLVINIPKKDRGVVVFVTGNRLRFAIWVCRGLFNPTHVMSFSRVNQPSLRMQSRGTTTS